MQNYIIVRGARENNLKNVDIDIPRDKLVVFTGLSGSGKSTLAFDTIFAEGQRRYVESLSSYARLFLGQMAKPDVDKIEGLSPAISIDQKTTSNNPRSTVGTVTEIYDYFRLPELAFRTAQNVARKFRVKPSIKLPIRSWQWAREAKFWCVLLWLAAKKANFKKNLKVFEKAVSCALKSMALSMT
jgi:excinuclease UvrABC ATPase subunit